MSGSSSIVGRPGTKAIARPPSDQHDRRRHLAELGEADQQRRRQHQDQDRLDVVHGA